MAGVRENLLYRGHSFKADSRSIERSDSRQKATPSFQNKTAPLNPPTAQTSIFCFTHCNIRVLPARPPSQELVKRVTRIRGCAPSRVHP